MAAFRSPRRSEKALSSSWCSRSSVRRSAIWRSRAARSRSRRSTSRTPASAATSSPRVSATASSASRSARAAWSCRSRAAANASSENRSAATAAASSWARWASLVRQGVPLGSGGRHRRGRLGQLLQPLAKEPAVVHDGLQLPVEDTEHRTVLGTERPTTGRALALGPEQLDFVPLLLQIVVLAQQLGPAGRPVFLFAHPHFALLFRGSLHRLQPLRQRQDLALRRGERRSGGPERVDAAVPRRPPRAQAPPPPPLRAPRHPPLLSTP